MDTFRIKLPHPQTVENEEEFVTNSGRKRKAVNNGTDSDSKDNYLTVNGSDDDMLGSGVSVLATCNDGTLHEREDLSDSVQAQLHLSLDRLSENYDPEDIKRLQDKSRSNRQWQQSGGLGIPILPSSKTPITANIQEKKKRNDVSRDLLDADSLNFSQAFEENTFGGSVAESDDDIHTVVDDSLEIPYDTNLEGTPVSLQTVTDARNSSFNNPSTAGQGDSLEHTDDKYASLRYDPNWIKNNARKPPLPPPVSPPMVVDFGNAPRLRESADFDTSGNEPPVVRTGGEITIHSNIIFSPTKSAMNEDFASQREPSGSTVRLSADPARLMKTNALYEEEFAKLLKTERITEDSTETNRNSLMQNQSLFEHSHDNEEVLSKRAPSQAQSAAKSEILIKPLDMAEEHKPPTRSPEEAAMKNYLTRGYHPLPDRHRYVEEYEVQSSTDSLTKQTSPNASSYRGQTLPFHDISSDKKNPLGALSPRGKGANRKHLAPTPPKVPKPRNQKDYIELNKQRLNRKTNSASYLELHAKRTIQQEQQKLRSHSELRFDVKKTQSNTSQNSNENEYDEFNDDAKTVEDVWSRQSEKLKRVKTENLNKGKVFRPTPQQYNRNAPLSQVMTSPKHLHDASDAESLRNRKHNLYNAQMVNGMTEEEQNAFMQLQNNGEMMRNPSFPSSIRHELPLPSHNAYLPSIHFLNRNEVQSNVNAFNDAQQPFQLGYLELDQLSPRPYGLNPNIHDSADAPRTYFNDQHLSLPSQQELANRADIWTNPYARDHQQMGNEYAALPPSQSPRDFSPRRKVTFFGDKTSLIMDSSNIEQQAPVLLGDMHRLNKYKVPLPPTPPRKSQNSVHRGSLERSSFGKENVDTEGLQGTYSILPPILKSGKQETPLKTSLNQKNVNIQSKDPGFYGSYIEKHEKNKQKPQYKVYTLADYKCLKKESVRYGGLGPDLEGAREKVEKLERTKKYAEFVRQQHKTNIVSKDAKASSNELADYGYELGNYQHHFSTTMDDKIRRQQYERRQRAIEYSKQIPLPKQKSESNVTPNSTTQNSLLPSRKSSQQSNLEQASPTQSGSRSTYDPIDFDWGALQVLKERHDREKAQVAAFAGNS